MITFIGTGEPLLHPRAFEFISFAKEKRFEVKLFTNGTLLDESRIKTLIDLRLDTLSVSLWAEALLKNINNIILVRMQRIGHKSLQDYSY